MPSTSTVKVRKRKEAVLKLLADACKPTTGVAKDLDLTHTEAYYVLELLKAEGYVVKFMLGKTAIWCLNNEEYNRTVNELLREIQRIVEAHNLRYVYPVRLYRLILKDKRAYELMSKFVPMHYNTIALRFLNHLLGLLYGRPYFVGEKRVYLTIRDIKPQTLKI